jgi:hypothetical protein
MLSLDYRTFGFSDDSFFSFFLKLTINFFINFYSSEESYSQMPYFVSSTISYRLLLRISFTLSNIMDTEVASVILLRVNKKLWMVTEVKKKLEI